MLSILDIEDLIYRLLNKPDIDEPVIILYIC